MRMLAVALAVASGLSSISASAQIGAQSNIQNRLANFQDRIQAGVESGSITRTEAAPLRDQLRQVQQLERRYAAGGLTPDERNLLQPRVRSLRQQIATAERNDYSRPGTRRDDGEEDWAESDRGVGGERYASRDEDWNEERYADELYSGGGEDRFDDEVGARVGSRVPGAFGALPYELRSEFPETERHTFRFWNGRIYQADRRTGVIVRIYEAER